MQSKSVTGSLDMHPGTGTAIAKASHSGLRAWLIDRRASCTWAELIRLHNLITRKIPLKIQLIAAVCAAFAPIAFGQSAAAGALQQDAAHTYALYPSGKVIGLDVRNDSQKDIGDIGDLLIDPRSGEIRYAVLEVGGVLGVGEERRVVPWTFIQIVADEKDAEKCHAHSTLTEQQVKAAPTCKADQKLDADLDKRIEATFGKNDGWAYVGKGDPAFASCSHMNGVVVKDPANKEIGKVKELILAPANGCVAYAIIDTNKEAGDKHIALPWGRLSYSYSQEQKLMAVTPIELGRFATAPEYDSKDWKRVSSTPWLTELSTYYTCDPFWKTTRFASARKAPATRP